MLLQGTVTLDYLGGFRKRVPEHAEGLVQAQKSEFSHSSPTQGWKPGPSDLPYPLPTLPCCRTLRHRWMLRSLLWGCQKPTTQQNPPVETYICHQPSQVSLSHLKSAPSFHQAGQMSPHNKLDRPVLTMASGLLPCPQRIPGPPAPHLPVWLCSPSALGRLQLWNSFNSSNTTHFF